jgi:transposase
VAGAWAAAGRPGVVVHPRQARDCAKATGRWATTDSLEAQGLAHLAAAVRPPPRPRPEAQAHALSALLTRRRQAPSPWLERRVARPAADLAAALRSSLRWLATDEILQSLPGVGPVLSRTLVAEGPEVALVHRQKRAALSGVAPFNGGRGRLRGQRVVWGGRAPIRAVLSMSTLSAVRHNPVLKAFYDRRRAAGQAAKVALTASMRKRLTILNAMIKHHSCGHAKTA